MTEFDNNCPAVTALVVTFNRKTLLQECLSAIMAQDYPVTSIVVIDNASTDGTAELFTDMGAYANDSLVDYHRMATNLGGAGGFKTGIDVARQGGTDWIWLMDDDCIPYPDTLSTLIDAAYKLHGHTITPSFLASTVFGCNGEPMNVPVVDNRASENGYADWYMLLQDGMVEIESATFVSLLINGLAVDKLGLPIGSFFIWGDDTEYTTRLTHNFGPAYLVGTSRVLHKRANATNLDIFSEDDPKRIANFRHLYRNNLVVQRAHHGKKATAKLILRDLAAALRGLTSGKGAPIRLARSKAIFAGVFEFVAGKYDLEDLGLLLNK